VNLRAAPATDAKIVTIVNQTKYVYIIDGPELSDDGRPWFKVDYDGDIGWMIGSYLSPAKPRRPPAQRPVAAPVRAPSAAVATAPPIVIPANSGVGGSIAQNALKLIGSRYAFGGSSPASGFDCSGFVAYVLGAFGINPGRSSDDQAGAGYHVAPNQLLPGDIVVFANTYAGGYSHTGIYLGGGKFIHAEDWDTGVVVSSVFGGYWGRHYAGARRPW
jgi:cell wall-associated NlpC family hydrolase